jgi:tRNA A37 threonylcarbamoyladenosine synthetase subunit TsaC/SUA5/YrdC
LVNAKGGIGVRISSQPIAAKLVEAVARPLTATSANPSGQPPARTAELAKKYFAGRVAVFVEGGELTSSTGSTVVEVAGESLRIIRAGDVRRAQLEEVVGTGRIVP